jgi:arylsulfatase
MEAPDLKRPNFLLVVTDDMGYSDLGAFGGSDIPTPNLDRLALSGVRFSSFHVAPSCAPTRSMLMSGTGNHEAGLGSQLVRPEYEGEWGYERYIPPRIATLPEVLRADGYHTYMTGKWHLASGDPSDASLAGNRGFERTFAMILGGEGHIETVASTPIYSADGRRLTESPQDFHTSTLFVDKLLEFLASNEGDSQPFFAWFAPTAPHWPLQPPPDRIDRFAGAYDDGFDELCKRRMAGALETGVLSPNARTEDCDKSELPWEALDPDKRAMYRRSMELYAAMVEHLDIEFQRLVDYLQSSGELENTYIIFMNDNGAQGGPFESRPPDDQRDNSLENLGRKGSWINVGAGWADAMSIAYRGNKQVQYEGGIRVPAFIWHADVADKGIVDDQLLTVMDVMPTILDLAGTPQPDGTFDGRQVLPMRGKSFASVVGSDSRPAHRPEETIALASAGRNVMFRGPWKLIRELGRDWELYNLVDDPSETTDLAASRPELMRDLRAAFDRYAEERNYLDRVPTATTGPDP